MKNFGHTMVKENARSWLQYANQKCVEIYNRGEVTKSHYELMLKENKANYDRRIKSIKGE